MGVSCCGRGSHRRGQRAQGVLPEQEGARLTQLSHRPIAQSHGHCGDTGPALRLVSGDGGLGPGPTTGALAPPPPSSCSSTPDPGVQSSVAPCERGERDLGQSTGVRPGLSLKCRAEEVTTQPWAAPPVPSSSLFLALLRALPEVAWRGDSSVPGTPASCPQVPWPSSLGAEHRAQNHRPLGHGRGHTGCRNAGQATHSDPHHSRQ